MASSEVISVGLMTIDQIGGMLKILGRRVMKKHSKMANIARANKDILNFLPIGKCILIVRI